MEYFKMWGPEFFKALNDDNWENAIQIKNDSIPNSIFKYFSLFDNKYKDFEKKNEEKLDSLENQYLWCSETKALNDPFELKVISLDRIRIEKAGWPIDLVEQIMGLLTKNITICCFSNNDRKRIPLWAHYANDHNGYCVEFVVENKDLIFPVHYTNSRLPSAVIITNLCRAFLDSYNKKDKPSLEFWHYYRILQLSFYTKSSEWKYEHEYRYLDINENDIKTGNLVPFSKMGLRIDKIMIGINCDSNCQQRLINIGKNLNCKVYKMEIFEKSNKFSLKRNLLI